MEIETKTLFFFDDNYSFQIDLFFSLIWMILFLYGCWSSFFYSHVKLVISYRLNHPGFIYFLLSCAALSASLAHFTDLFFPLFPGFFLMLSFLLSFSAGLSLLLDWARLAGKVSDNPSQLEAFFSDFQNIQAMLNSLVYVICFLSVFLSAGNWTSGIFFTNVFTIVVLGFYAMHAVLLFSKAQLLKHHYSTDSFRFRHINALMLLAISTLFLLSMASAVSLGHLVSLPVPRLLVSLLHLLFFFLASTVLSYANSLKFLLPNDPKDLTVSFLDALLKARGNLSPANAIPTLQRFPLVEGCHFRVSRFVLQYADPEEAGAQKAPHALVVKILAWSKPLHERLLLALNQACKGADPSEKNAMYLRSYQVEARFYRNYAAQVRGFRIPKVYLNLDDSIRCHFGLIMQEVAISVDGVVAGFNFQESRFVLKKLARFHGTNWVHPDMHLMNVWRQGGYWAGYKRRAEILPLVQNWDRILDLFGGAVDFPLDHQRLAARIHPFIDTILDSIEHEQPRTLLHGDFKVGNIFISSKGKNHPHHLHLHDAPSSDPISAVPPLLSINLRAANADDDDDDDGALPATPIKPKQVQSKKKGAKAAATDPSAAKSIIKKAPKQSVESTSPPMTESIEDSSRLYVIDWQWFGCGLAATDVAHYIWTSTNADIVTSESQIHELLRHYHQALKRAGAKDYSFKQLFRHFQLATVDYFIYMCAKWSLSSPSEFAHLAKQSKNGLTSRSLIHMAALTKATYIYFGQLFDPQIQITRSDSTFDSSSSSLSLSSSTPTSSTNNCSSNTNTCASTSTSSSSMSITTSTSSSSLSSSPSSSPSLSSSGTITS